jgi:hypothetical protein
MKAVDYYNKYGPKIFSLKDKDDIDGEVLSLLREFNQEIVSLCDIRNVETNIGMAGIILELNQKWNALANLFIAGYGLSPILQDGYKRFWMLQTPDMAPYLERRRTV